MSQPPRSPLGALALPVLLAVPALLALAVAAPAAASQAALRAACENLADYVANPANCTPGDPCEKVFPKLAKALGKAKSSLDGDRVDAALKALGGAIAALQKAGLVAGQLQTLVQAVVDAADSCAGDAAMEIEDRKADLCPKPLEGVRKKEARPAAALAAARAHRAAQEWPDAMKDYAAALKGYAGLDKIADKGPERPCPPEGVKACRDDTPVLFTPGPGTECEEVRSPPSGTQLCYDAGTGTGGAGLDGEFCFLSGKPNSFKLSCDVSLDIPGAGVFACTCSGRASAKPCLDSAGWLRIAKLGEKLKLTCPGAGSVSVAVSGSFSPPTVSFAGGLLPLPPGGVEFCVGDVMSEQNVDTRIKVSAGGQSAPVAGTCSLQHTVEALEPRSVPAGLFDSVRIRSTGSCTFVVDGFQEVSNTDCTAWIADGVGLVSQDCTVDGDTQGFDLQSVLSP